MRIQRDTTCIIYCTLCVSACINTLLDNRSLLGAVLLNSILHFGITVQWRHHATKVLGIPTLFNRSDISEFSSWSLTIWSANSWQFWQGTGVLLADRLGTPSPMSKLTTTWALSLANSSLSSLTLSLWQQFKELLNEFVILVFISNLI